MVGSGMSKYHTYPILLTEEEHKEVMRYLNHIRYVERLEEDMVHIQYRTGAGLKVEFPKFGIHKWFGFPTYGGFHEAFAAAKEFRDGVMKEYRIRPSPRGRPRNLIKRIW